MFSLEIVQRWLDPCWTLIYNDIDLKKLAFVKLNTPDYTCRLEA